MKKIFLNIIIAALFMFMFSSCAKPKPENLSYSHEQESNFPDFLGDDEDYEYDEPFDPIQPVNKVFFYGNDKFYRWTFIPVNAVYKKNVNNSVQNMVSNFFHNLATPARFVGNILVFKINNAGLEFGGFIINTITSLGLCDLFKDDDSIKQMYLFEVAKTWGIPAGPYVVIPILGPSTLRDAIAGGVELYLYPPSYLGMAASVGTGVVKLSTEPNYNNYIDGFAASPEPYVGFRTATFDRNWFFDNRKNGKHCLPFF